MEGQERRDKGYVVSQYEMQAIRIALEDRLNELREKLALVYDFQGDRGMADFVPAGFNHKEVEEEEEEAEVEPLDFTLFPKKKENHLKTFFDNYYAVA